MVDFIEEIRRLDKDKSTVVGLSQESGLSHLEAQAPRMAKALIEIADLVEDMEIYDEGLHPESDYGKGYVDAIKAVREDLQRILNKQGEGDES